MRLKKSSSGTVGPRVAGGGGAQRWSSKREPWEGKCGEMKPQHPVYVTLNLISAAQRAADPTTYLTLDEHIEEVVIGLGAVGVGHQVAEHGLVAALVESQTRQTSSCWGRVAQPPARGAGDVDRLRCSCRVKNNTSDYEATLEDVLNFKDSADSHFRMVLGGEPGPLFNDNLLPLSCMEQRWSSIRLLWKRLRRSKKPSSPSMSGLRRCWNKKKKEVVFNDGRRLSNMSLNEEVPCFILSVVPELKTDLCLKCCWCLEGLYWSPQTCISSHAGGWQRTAWRSF